jgi:hypothetical protein
MLRHSYGNRPFHNETCLYGWGYNGTSGPDAFQSEFPTSYYGDTLNANQAAEFYTYSRTVQNGNYMGAAPYMYDGPPAFNNYGNITFGGLGIGIDFPLYHTDETLAGFNKGRRLDGGQDILTNRVPTEGPPLTVVRSHVPLPVRLDDYDDSGERLGRENWVKLQGGVGECLGIKSSGNTLHDSGHLYGWGVGSYNGGSSLHSSMRFWSCVPEICDSGSSKFFPDSVGGGSRHYSTDSANHIVSEPYGDDDMSLNWIDVACATQGGEVFNVKQFSWYLGVKDGKLYTWGYKPWGKGEKWRDKSQYRIGRVFVVDNVPSANSGPPKKGAISATQPTFTKCFGGVGCAAAITSLGELYFMGSAHNLAHSESFAGRRQSGKFYLPTKVAIWGGSFDDYGGFQWWDSGYYDIVVVQRGDIFHARRQFNNSKIPYSEWSTLLFTEIDDSTSEGSTMPIVSEGGKWAQAYTLTKRGTIYEDDGGIVALNEAGQIWIRIPDWEEAEPQGAGGQHTYKHLTPDKGEAWTQISPTGVTFTKIILNPAHAGSDKDHSYQIMGLTDKGEIYITDNTTHNLFPYVDFPNGEDSLGQWWGDEKPTFIDRGYCPLNSDGFHDPVTTIHSPPTTHNDTTVWNGVNNLSSFGGDSFRFTKVKPPSIGNDGLWWDQKNPYCFIDLGWPWKHPSVPSIADPEDYFGKYLWGLEYNEVDGTQKLSFLPVKNRTNKGAWSRKPPALSWSSANIDNNSNNPNIQNGLIESSTGYDHHGEIGDKKAGSRAPYGFGKSVATNEDGSIIAVASPHYPDYEGGPNNTGSVEVFRDTLGGAAGSDSKVYTKLGDTILWSALDSYQGDEAGNLEALSISNHVGTEDNLESIVVAVGSRTASRASATGIVRTYKYSKSTSTWSQMGADIVGTSAEGGSQIVGCSLSDDGLTLAVGYWNDAGTDYLGEPILGAGLVRVYTWSGSAWVAKGSTIHPANTQIRVENGAGWRCQLNDDGNTVVISCANNVFHDQVGQPGVWGHVGKGQVVVYEYDGDWTRKGQKIDASTPTTIGPYAGGTRETGFSYSVAINGAGNTIIVGERDWNSTFDGINPNNGVIGWGLAHIYVYNSIRNRWDLFQTLQNPDDSGPTRFGHAVAMDRSGDTVVVGAPWSEATLSSKAIGQVFIYKRSAVGEDYVLHNRNNYEDPDADMTSTLSNYAGTNLGWGVDISRDGLITVAGVPGLGGPKPNGTGARVKIYKQVGSTYLPAIIQFRHPRRQLSESRDFLWDGQDAHTFVDGWEDLTVARWSSSLYNKYWGTR